MTFKQALRIFCVGISLAAASAPVPAKTTDQSDLWWIPSESGWGIQFVQQENTIFATMFVYGANGQATWYVATMSPPTAGTLNWSGTLYATTGPWFGAGAFNPAQVTATPVGTMALDVLSVNQATLSYDVNGVQVTKQIQRQTLVTLDFSGDYIGTLSQSSSEAGCQGSNTPGVAAGFSISMNGSAMTVVAQAGTGGCTFTGPYTQGGHFGAFAGNYACSTGDSGTFQIFEMATSWYDFRARLLLNSQSGCTFTGFVNGLRQPPPPQ